MYEVQTYSAIGLWARSVVHQHGITKPPRHEVPPVLGPMHGMRYHMNIPLGMCPTCHPDAIRERNVSQQSGVLKFGAVFVTCNRHNPSRKGFREKDPGYFRIRANKDLWWDLCTESNISFGVLFHYQRQKKTWQIWQGTHRRGTHSPFCLCPVSYLRFFENPWNLSKRQIASLLACTLTL